MPGYLYLAETVGNMASGTALVGMFFVGASLVLMVVAFASPYWVESYEEFKAPFIKLGLWEFCFNDYTFYKDYNGKRYLGCFYVFSPEIRPIWEWVSPRKCADFLIFYFEIDMKLVAHIFIILHTHYVSVTIFPLPQV